MSSFHFIAAISFLSAFIPILCGLIYRRKGINKFDNLILLGIISFLIDIICLVYFFKKQNNWPFINLYIIIQVVILFTILYRFNKRKWALIFGILFIGYASYNFYWFFNQSSVHTPTDYISSAFLIAFALDCIDKLMVELPVRNIYQHPIFWICCGVFLYFTGNFFPFLFNNHYLKLNMLDMRAYWILHNFLNVCKNICFALAIWSQYKIQPS